MFFFAPKISLDQTYDVFLNVSPFKYGYVWGIHVKFRACIDWLYGLDIQKKTFRGFKKQ